MPISEDQLRAQIASYKLRLKELLEKRATLLKQLGIPEGDVNDAQLHSIITSYREKMKSVLNTRTTLINEMNAPDTDIESQHAYADEINKVTKLFEDIKDKYELSARIAEITPQIKDISESLNKRQKMFHDKVWLQEDEKPRTPEQLISTYKLTLTKLLSDRNLAAKKLEIPGLDYQTQVNLVNTINSLTSKIKDISEKLEGLQISGGIKDFAARVKLHRAIQDARIAAGELKPVILPPLPAHLDPRPSREKADKVKAALQAKFNKVEKDKQARLKRQAQTVKEAEKVFGEEHVERGVVIPAQSNLVQSFGAESAPVPVTSKPTNPLLKYLPIAALLFLFAGL